MHLAFIIIFILIIVLFTQVADIKSRLDELGKKLSDSDNLAKPAKLAKPSIKAVLQATQSSQATATQATQATQATAIQASQRPQVRALRVAAPRPPKSPSPPKEEKSSFNFEKIFLENIFNKLGAIALIIGVATFIKLISPHFVFNPLSQVISAYLLGFALVITSWRIHSKQMKNYAEMLMGTGLAIFFVATYGATSFYQLIPDAAALIIGTILVLFSYIIAHKYKTFSTIVIGMIGAYLTPLIVGHYNSIEFLFIYFIFINIVTALYSYVNENKFILNYINLLLTTAYIFVYSSYGHEISYLLPLLLWGFYLIFDFIWLKNGKKYERINYGLVIINYFTLILFSLKIFNIDNQSNIGIILTCIGLFYFALACMYRKLSKNESFIYQSGGILAILFATFFIEDSSLRTCIWALEGLTLGFITSKWKALHFEKWTLIALSTSFIASLYGITEGAMPSSLWNIQIVALGVPSLLMLAVALMIKSQHASISSLLKFLALILIYILSILEINTALSMLNLDSGINEFMIYVMIAFSYVLISMKLYQETKFKLFAITSYAVFSIACLSLTTVGSAITSSLELLPILNMRFAAYAIAIGVTLLLSKNQHASISSFLKFLALALIYILLVLESNTALSALNLNSCLNEFMIYVMIAFSYVLISMKLYQETKFKLFAIASYTVYSIAFLSLITVGIAITSKLELIPVLNMQFAAYAVAIGATLLLSKNKHASISSFLKFLALVLIYILLVLEVNTALPILTLDSRLNEFMIYVMIAFSYVLFSIKLYQATKFKLFAITSYAVFSIACLSLITVGSAITYSLELIPVFNMRCAAYAVAIGVTLLLSKNQHANISSSLKFLALKLIYILLVLEINTTLSILNLDSSLNEFMIYVMIALSYVLFSMKLYQATKFKLFAMMSYTSFSIACLSLITVGSAITYKLELIPVFNIRCAAYALAIGVALLLAKSRFSTLFKYIAIILGFCLISIEAYTAAAPLEDPQSKSLCMSLAWILYSAALMTMGIFKDIKTLKLAGIWIIILSSFKIVFYDLAQIDALYKTIAFLLLGTVLLAISYYYNKKLKK